MGFRTTRVAVLLGLALVALSGVVGPAQAAAAPPAKGWIGAVPGTRAFVGLVASGQDVTAYVCDGRRVGRWYTGRLRGGRAVLRDERGRRLAVRITGRTATGVVDLPGRRAARFTARAARGRAGVFQRQRARSDVVGRPSGRTLEGWIRLNDGRVRGLSRIETFRLRTPAPDVQVHLLPSPLETAIAPPSSGPPDGARLLAGGPRDPCASISRPARGGRRPPPFGTGPTCGLPAAGMTLGVRRGSGRLRSRPAAFPLSNAAVDRLLADLPRLDELEEARVLQATGLPSLPPSFPPAPAVRRLGALAEAMIRNRALTAAATRVRFARTAEERSARLAAYNSLGDSFLDPQLGLRRRNEFAVTTGLGAVAGPPFSQEVTVSGPFLVFDDTRLEGPDAEVTESEHFLDFADTREEIGGLARAGFFSKADFDIYAVLSIDVPPGAREVEIAADPAELYDFDTQLSCLAGGGWAWAGVTMALHGRNADGTFHILEDPPIDGSSHFEFDDAGIPLPFGICPLSPPVPRPPVLDITYPPLRISDPPAGGGTFLLTFGVHAGVYTVSDGKAAADVRLSIFDVKVRSRF